MESTIIYTDGWMHKFHTGLWIILAMLRKNSLSVLLLSRPSFVSSSSISIVRQTVYPSSIGSCLMFFLSSHKDFQCSSLGCCGQGLLTRWWESQYNREMILVAQSYLTISDCDYFIQLMIKFNFYHAFVIWEDKNEDTTVLSEFGKRIQKRRKRRKQI